MSVSAQDRSGALLHWPLYAIFFLTGVAVASPGAMLPLLARLWQLNDADLGLLLFGFFAGSSVGSLGARGPLRLTIAASCAVTALMAFVLGSGAVRGAAPLWLMDAFGVALGVCMTSISLQQSRSNAHRRIAEMARLNLVWAAGALTGPVFCLHLAAAAGTGEVFRALGGCFLLATAAPFLTRQQNWRASGRVPRQPGRTFRLREFASLLCLIPLATGIEGGVGGWLTTYASRSGLSFNGDIGLASLFWAGLLLSRAAYANRRIASRASLALRWNTLLAAFGVALLCMGRPPSVLFTGAFCVGWGLGSLYPIAIAMLLDRTELNNFGFLIAGLGGSCMPLLTGFLSHATHSIRAGVAFLLLPAVCLVISGWRAATVAEAC